MLAHFQILTIVLLTTFFFRETLSEYEGNTCTDNNGQSGICTPLGDCEELIASLDSGAKPYICGTPGPVPIVCCPTEKTATHEKQANNKSQQKCQEYAGLRVENAGFAYEQYPAVVGGDFAWQAEFPHMAALGYGDENDISWLCGGSLISERFVLTAAHCLATRGRGLVRWVRLGASNLKRTNNTGETQQFAVEQLYRHPDCQPPARYNDIGLLKLDRNATFTDSVRPACLHTQETLPNSTVEATGWGLTEWGSSKLSDDLMKVELNFIDMEYCNRTYAPLVGGKKLKRGVDEETMLCVGELEGGKDTCQFHAGTWSLDSENAYKHWNNIASLLRPSLVIGDSGGPLHVRLESPRNMFDVIGITSFGSACGSKNTPAIYTRVSYFVPWIESIVWP